MFTRTTLSPGRSAGGDDTRLTVRSDATRLRAVRWDAGGRPGLALRSRRVSMSSLTTALRVHTDARRSAFARAAARLAEMTASQRTVTEADTAERLGSGDMPVLATPRLINWLERAAFAAAAEGLSEGQTTVGTLVKVELIKGSPVGATVSVHCSKPVSDGRRLIFHISVLDEGGEIVATGEVHRAVVDRERFLRRFGCAPDQASPAAG